MTNITLTNDPSTQLVSIDHGSGSLVYADLGDGQKLKIDNLLECVNNCMESDNFQLSVNTEYDLELNLVYASGDSNTNDYYSLEDVTNAESNLDELLQDIVELIN